MGEIDTLRSDAHRSGPPGAEDEPWAGRGFLGLGEVKTVESSRWRCLSCEQDGKGLAQFDRLAAEQHAETERHLVLHTYETAFVPAERLVQP